MKELDVVRLTKEFEGLTIGTKGTIVLEYDGKFFEVEFFDDDGNTIDVHTTPVESIELEKEFGSSPPKHLTITCGRGKIGFVNMT